MKLKSAHPCRRTLPLLIAAAASTFAISNAGAQVLWSSSGGSAWLTGTNWTGNAVPTATQVAQFGANPTAATGVGINFNGTTNAGTQTTGNRIQEAATIEVTSARAAAFLVGNSSTTAGASGTLRLLGATVNSVANTVLRNNSSQTFTIQNIQSSGNQTMALTLGNATNNVVNVDSTGNIVISSAINGGKLTLNAANSGDLRLSGTNTFTGGIDITGGTAGGRLRVDAVASLPTTGTVAVSTGGRLTLNVAGTYGGASQALTFSPNQTTNPALDILGGAAVIWQGTVGINANTRIEANGATGSLTFSGNVSGSGQLLKQASGTLTLSGTGNTLTGSTQIGNGTLSVSSGSSMGTGALTLAQTSNNATTLTLNNTVQSVGALSSSWTAITGTIDQRINLNGTALTVTQDADGTFGTGTVSTLTSTISGTGSLIKEGNSGLTLSGANNYTGVTTINAGTLTVNGSLASGSAVTVNSGGTLGGSGTVNGTVAVKSGGIVGPGNSPGILTTGAASFENSSIFSWELNSNLDGDTVDAGDTGTRGTNYDGLNSSSLTVASGAIFRVVLTGTADITNPFWDQNQAWNNIFNVSGSTTNAAIGQLFNAFGGSGVDFDGTVSGQGQFGFTGSTLTWTAVPEPTSALAGLLLGAGLLRRRRGV